MAKKLYIGVDGVAQEAKTIYVGVDGVAREVVKGFVGDENNIARLFWEKDDTTIEGKWNSLSSKADELVLQHTMFVYLGLSSKYSSVESIKGPYTQYLYKLNNEPMYYALACIDCPPNYYYYIIVLITLSQYENGGICYYYSERGNQGQVLLNGDGNVQTINYNNETWYLRYTTVSFSKDEINSGINAGYFTYGIENDKCYPECMLNDFSDAYPIGNEYNDTTLNNAVLSLSNSLLNKIHLNKIIAPQEPWENLVYATPLKVYKTNNITLFINNNYYNKNLENRKYVYTFNSSNVYLVPFYITYIQNYVVNDVTYTRRVVHIEIRFISDEPIIGTVHYTRYNSSDGSVIQDYSPSSIDTTNDSINYILGKRYYEYSGTRTTENYNDINSNDYLKLVGIDYNGFISYPNESLANSTDVRDLHLAYMIYFQKNIAIL